MPRSAEAARHYMMAELVTKAELQSSQTALEARLEAKMDNLGLRLTVRLGGLIVAGIGALAALIKLS